MRTLIVEKLVELEDDPKWGTEEELADALADLSDRAAVHGTPVGTIVFKNRHALFSWVWNPELNFGEAYMFGAVEIRGDLVAMARRDGEVLSEEYSDGVVSMRARVSAPVAGRLRKAAHSGG